MLFDGDLEKAKQYKSRQELFKKDNPLYFRLYRMGLIHLVPARVYTFWTKSKIQNEIDKYTTSDILYYKNNRLYQYLSKKHLLQKYYKIKN